MIKRKFYLEKIVKLIDTEDIKVITGVRRCGKTVLLKQIIDELENRGIASENIIYMSFESSKYKNIRNDDDLDEFIFSKTNNLNGKIYLLFDEIQKVKNWEVSLNSYRVDLECDIYITGSNSQLLSGELATLISGRYISINMLPFSFKELIQYYDEMHEKLNRDPNYTRFLTKRRSSRVEPVLGTLINYHNMKRVNTRGIKNVNKHVLMAALTYNLKKYLKFISKTVHRNAGIMNLPKGKFWLFLKPQKPAFLFAN